MAATVPKLKRFFRSDEGSIALEASMIMPIVFFLILGVILLAVWILNRSLAYYTASVESSRAAFAWAHSSADLRTGAYPAGVYDGLYWRLADDAVLAGLFGWDSGDGGGIRVDAGSTEASATSLAEAKLHKTAARISAWDEGAVTYRNQIWKKELTVEGGGSLLPVSLPGLQRTGASFRIASLVNEPAEWVRSFELIRYYRDKFKAQGNESETYRGKVSEVLKDRARNEGHEK